MSINNTRYTHNEYIQHRFTLGNVVSNTQRHKGRNIQHDGGYEVPSDSEHRPYKRPTGSPDVLDLVCDAFNPKANQCYWTAVLTSLPYVMTGEEGYKLTPRS